MDLKAKILESLDDSTEFNHSSVDLAKERLEGRSLSPLVFSIFCDSFSVDVDKAIVNYVDSFMDYFESNDNFVTYVPTVNGTARRLVRALRQRGRRVSGVSPAEGDWRVTDDEQEERVFEKILERTDAVLFVSSGERRDFRRLFHQACESGYLVTRRMFHEARSKKGGRG